jgi:hypothetical protein
MLNKSCSKTQKCKEEKKRRDSLYPLIKKDRLVLAWWALVALWTHLTTTLHAQLAGGAGGSSAPPPPPFPALRIARDASYAVMGLVLLLDAAVPPPGRWPDLWVVANVCVSATLFLAFWAYWLVSLWALRMVAGMAPQTARTMQPLAAASGGSATAGLGITHRPAVLGTASSYVSQASSIFGEDVFGWEHDELPASGDGGEDAAQLPPAPPPPAAEEEKEEERPAPRPRRAAASRGASFRA